MTRLIKRKSNYNFKAHIMNVMDLSGPVFNAAAKVVGGEKLHAGILASCSG